MSATPSTQEKFGFIVHLHLQPEGLEEVLAKRKAMAEQMIKEPLFVNCFLLQDEVDRTRFALYETWATTKESFLDLEMKRPYRREYEEILAKFSTAQPQMEINWRLVKSSTNLNASKRDPKFGFFVYVQTKPGLQDEYRSKVDFVVDRMIEAPTFLNYFLLQAENDPTKFALYETWSGTKEDFMNSEMKSPYRSEYEDSLPRLLAKPREIRANWRILDAKESYAAQSAFAS
jgi:quinol monooxygenase YgiN